jgi:hypothetical protein
MRARSCSTKRPLVNKKSQASPAATEASRRNSRFGPPLAFICARRRPQMCPPAVSLRIFPIRPRLLVASLRRSHFGTTAHASRRMTGEAQKGVLARRARVRRPNEPAEPMARRRDRRANPLRPLRKQHFTSEPRILVHERTAALRRAPFGARQDRHMRSVAGRDWQERSEDGGLFAVGEVRNDEPIAGERLKVEDVGAGLYVGDERIGVRVEIGAAHNKPERAQLANHVAAAGAGLEDRAFDLDRTAERRDNPARVDREVLVPVEAFKAARRDVAKIAGVCVADGRGRYASPLKDCNFGVVAFMRRRNSSGVGGVEKRWTGRIGRTRKWASSPISSVLSVLSGRPGPLPPLQRQ